MLPEITKYNANTTFLYITVRSCMCMCMYDGLWLSLWFVSEYGINFMPQVSWSWKNICANDRIEYKIWKLTKNRKESYSSILCLKKERKKER